MLKRLFDIVSSIIGIIFLSPIFFIMAIWIKSDSKGPVFYKQIRVGRNRKSFLLFKFRSMKVGSDKNGLLTVGNKDSRITKSGEFIRRFKLDEFPQLINVIRGEMSLVGPRPEVPQYVKFYNEEQLQVLKVKPGITDWASIRFRNENELLSKAEDPEEYYIKNVLVEKLRINLEYIERKNFWVDIKIILATLKTLISQ